jgi:hypothetical protein
MPHIVCTEELLNVIIRFVVDTFLISNLSLRLSLSEHCPAGKLWDLVRPLVEQQQQQQQPKSLAEPTTAEAGSPPTTTSLLTGESVMRPSPSFIIERQELLHNSTPAHSIAESNSSSNNSESDDSELADMSVVLAENSSLLGKDLQNILLLCLYLLYTSIDGPDMIHVIREGVQKYLFGLV